MIFYFSQSVLYFALHLYLHCFLMMYLGYFYIFVSVGLPLTAAQNSIIWIFWCKHSFSNQHLAYLQIELQWKLFKCVSLASARSLLLPCPESAQELKWKPPEKETGTTGNEAGTLTSHYALVWTMLRSHMYPSLPAYRGNRFLLLFMLVWVGFLFVCFFLVT